MRFALTEEQRGFADSLAGLLAGADVSRVARRWAEGDHEPGWALWRRLADQGVCALVVPENLGGLGATPVDLVVAHEQLGRAAVPGPWVESTAYLPALLAHAAPDVVRALAEGALGSAAVAPHTPLALDADIAEHVHLVDESGVRRASPGARHRSLAPARRLFDVAAVGDAVPAPDAAGAFDVASLACAARLLGLGDHLLAATVGYAGQRRQFGRAIGSYQALKHRLADVRIALDFARPVVYGAALALDSATASRDVSAAKVCAGDAAHLAARTALQLHGAVGYTAEHDLSLWLLETRALVTAWGTPAFHRGRVLAALVAAPAEEPS